MTDFASTRTLFDLPDGVVYLNGNSLGPLPVAAQARVDRTITAEWGEMLITAWNRAGWMALPRALGDRIGALIGAEPGSVVVGDTLSIKVYQALASALEMRPDRRVILSDSGNFPSDLYMAEGLIATLGLGHELRVVAPDQVEAAITDEIAVTLITEVDYGTARRHDMASLTRKAHEVGAVTVWDLAHSAGAIPVDLAGCGVDFAVGCTYKYLNSGPGGPAFIYIRPDLAQRTRPALSGWLGHEAPFAFDQSYRPGAGIERMRVGTPPILQMAALDAALDVWDGVDLAVLRTRSMELSELLISRIDETCPDLRLASPRDAGLRGSHVGYRFADGYALMQALIARGVIGDFRAPDLIRFGITPLFLDEADIIRATDILADILATRAWDRPEFHRKAAVT